MDLKQQMRMLAERSRDAARALAKLDSKSKNAVLLSMADGLERDAAKITPSQGQAIHQALKVISGMCDGAHQRDGTGFSRVDVMVGKSLAQELILRIELIEPVSICQMPSPGTSGSINLSFMHSLHFLALYVGQSRPGHSIPSIVVTVLVALVGSSFVSMSIVRKETSCPSPLQTRPCVIS